MSFERVLLLGTICFLAYTKASNLRRFLNFPVFFRRLRLFLTFSVVFRRFMAPIIPDENGRHKKLPPRVRALAPTRKCNTGEHNMPLKKVLSSNDVRSDIMHWFLIDYKTLLFSYYVMFIQWGLNFNWKSFCFEGATGAAKFHDEMKLSKTFCVAVGKTRQNASCLTK